MKRALWVVIGGAAVALAIVYGVRLAAHRASSGVAALLPRDTIAFAHLPDLNRTIEEWHHSDIYQIYLEPAVQAFLQTPIGQTPKTGSVSDRIREFQELDSKDGFVALTSAANDKPKFVAGFEFGCSQAVADRVIGGWRSSMNPSAKRDRVAYEKHEIEVFSQSAFSVAMVQDQNWFFAGNDLDEIKAVLDRADGRIKDRQTLLSNDESFRDAMSAMPGSYALLVYFQPKTLSERLAALRKSFGQTTEDQPALLRQVRSVCLTTRFDHGKLHDVVFVGMPKQEHKTELTRSSLALASRATIFYAATVVDFSRQIGLLFPPGENNALGPALQQIGNALAAAGVTPSDWEAAFGAEVSMVSEWSEQTHWPSLFITASVKDHARARKIIDALTRGFGGDQPWEEADRNGVHYWSVNSSSGWLSIRPVMALSDRVWITGLDAASVETAVRRSQNPEPGLAESDNYRRVVQLVPVPTNFFTYADPVQMYSRIDATVRPILLMAAAFVPKANDFVDLSKVPPPEAITKHLSPIVSSQYYAGKGYVAESVGPVTLNQAAIGVGVLGGVGAVAYQRLLPGGFKGFGIQAANPPGGGAATVSSSPSVTPSPSVVAPASVPTATATPRPRHRRKP